MNTSLPYATRGIKIYRIDLTMGPLYQREYYEDDFNYTLLHTRTCETDAENDSL